MDAITPRIVPRSPAEQVRRLNLRVRPWDDVYHRTMSLSWGAFIGYGSLAYLVANVVFALLYLVQPGSIAGARPGSAADAFFFAVQTTSTIGYGQMYPATFYANVLVTAQAVVGLLIIALSTGMTFARISRPTARVMFARAAVVGPWNGVPTLTVRMGNERRSQILEADVRVTLLRYEQSAEGVTFRRFHDLVLTRPHTPVFSLTYTAMHAIDEGSPLFGATAESLAAEGAELLVTVQGLEEVTSQTVHARWSYGPGEILFGARYVDIFMTDGAGRAIDYGRFHQTEPLAGAGQRSMTT